MIRRRAEKGVLYPMQSNTSGLVWRFCWEHTKLRPDDDAPLGLIVSSAAECGVRGGAKGCLPADVLNEITGLLQQSLVV